MDGAAGEVEGVGDVEEKRLVPRGVEVVALRLRAAPLPVELHLDVGARRAVAVLR